MLFIYITVFKGKTAVLLTALKSFNVEMHLDVYELLGMKIVTTK